MFHPKTWTPDPSVPGHQSELLTKKFSMATLKSMARIARVVAQRKRMRRDKYYVSLILVLVLVFLAFLTTASVPLRAPKGLELWYERPVAIDDPVIGANEDFAMVDPLGVTSDNSFLFATSVMSHLTCWNNYGILTPQKGGWVCQRLNIGYH